jgi:hypothetical protein
MSRLHFSLRFQRLRLLAIVALVPLLVVGGCASASRNSPAPASSGTTAQEAARSASAPAPARAPGGGTAGNAGTADTSQAQNLPSADRMIIRTVTMTIAVQDVQEAFRLAERIANEQGGLIAGSQIRQDGDRLTATLTIRVPSDSATYQETLARLRTVAERVVEEQAQAQDITEEYVDIEARLRNLQASEQSLLALLQRATSVEDILQIQRELTSVRGQIEQIQGRKQALERRADMATITLTIREAGAFARAGWNPGDTVGEAIRALGQAARALATLGIWLLIFSPIWGGFLLALWLLGRFLRRRVGRGQVVAPAAPAPASSVAAPSPPPATA